MTDFYLFVDYYWGVLFLLGFLIVAHIFTPKEDIYVITSAEKEAYIFNYKYVKCLICDTAISKKERFQSRKRVCVKCCVEDKSICKWCPNKTLSKSGVCDKCTDEYKCPKGNLECYECTYLTPMKYISLVDHVSCMFPSCKYYSRDRYNFPCRYHTQHKSKKDIKKALNVELKESALILKYTQHQMQ